MLCLTHRSASWEPPMDNPGWLLHGRQLMPNGSLSLEGTFAEGTQGSYTLRVDDGKTSNTIYFVISDCRPGRNRVARKKA
jgi:hypothetical protein